MSHAVLARLGLSEVTSGVAVGGEFRKTTGPALTVRSPIDGATLSTLQTATVADVGQVIEIAEKAFRRWRTVPAPRRGEFVRRVGNKLRERKSDLAALVSLEAGKITQEALGEVQEMIDICDFAVGLSRQLYGLTIASERAGHRMMEQWHPLGVVGCISAFNFPVAVWAWNAMLAWVCGDSVVWKPSEKTPLTAMACQKIVAEVMAEMPEVPPGIMGLVIGGGDAGHALASSPSVPLLSATGSTRMGIQVAQTVGSRLGRCLLELGGNNAMIVSPTADLELATRAIVFSAAGTAGQRCTTLRRLIVHESVRSQIVTRLTAIFARLKVGNPLEEGTLVGPLIDAQAGKAMEHALAEARKAGGQVHGGEKVTIKGAEAGLYYRPAIVEIAAGAAIVKEETFAPILYISTYKDLDDAIVQQNDVSQGLSSAIFTTDVREAELFLSPSGSDCGIANVNIGTSGAEIGGAFGGEKSSGGGRESGSDAWKNYMRRTTNTVNYSKDLPLAQGINFTV
ncbi:MAG TPA: aldehyde dehydrogenase family protein [Tepidisphaeraceae bacterium]|jgi:aldehyde dehydrogenase (NAD+)|nr:aldehyde dehydrogenase family protein [Tepidisphaeraceae bacterium]